MSSPFRRRQQMIRGLMAGTVARATTAAPAAPDASTPAGQEYATLLVLLHENLRKLSDIASHEARNPVKAEMAPAFADWIVGVLEAGKTAPAAQDEILLWNMIWAVDYRNLDYALELGAHAIRHNLIMPSNQTRTVACFLAEDIAHLALSENEAVTHEQLLAVHALVESCDMPDPVMARLHKCIGRSFEKKAADFDPADDNAPAGGKAAFIAASLEHLTRARALDKQVGVKKDIERMTRAAKVEAEKAEAALAATE